MLAIAAELGCSTSSSIFHGFDEQTQMSEAFYGGRMIEGNLLNSREYWTFLPYSPILGGPERKGHYVSCGPG